MTEESYGRIARSARLGEYAGYKYTSLAFG